MGTNYYEVNKATGEKIHIGKLSMGWKFIFRHYTETPSASAWGSRLLQLTNGKHNTHKIEDEYGNEIEFLRFIDMILSSQVGRCHFSYCEGLLHGNMNTHEKPHCHLDPVGWTMCERDFS